jgi:hypothetical protein
LINFTEKVVCYWSAEVPAAQINPMISTHIIYSFLGVTANGGLNYLQRSEYEALGECDSKRIVAFPVFSMTFI